MPGQEFPDLLVLLPGILGSVLERGGKTVWDANVSLLLSSRDGGLPAFQRLALPPDDPDAPLAPDGVVATELIQSLTIFPGLAKADHYGPMIEALESSFDLNRTGDVPDSSANFLIYPYDWRRDIVGTAKRLAEEVRKHLDERRKDVPEAKVVFLAHSMGGLITRYAIEVHELHEDTRQLITLGTPYRGAPLALDVLTNGPRLPVIRTRVESLKGMIATLPSLHQLLPRYPVIEWGGKPKRIEELGPETFGIDRAMFGRMVDYHAKLDEATARHRGPDGNRPPVYTTIPIIGTAQKTILATTWNDGRLTTMTESPAWLPATLPGGDGTVPWLAGVPLDQSKAEDFIGFHLSQKHESLPKDQKIIDDVLARLSRVSAGDLSRYHGSAVELRPGELGLDVSDVMIQGTPLSIEARCAPGDESRLRAVVETADGRTISSVELAAVGAGNASASLESPPIGYFRVTLTAIGSDRYSPVTAALAVLEAEPGA